MEGPTISAESAGTGDKSRSHGSEVGGHAARDSARDNATFHGKGTSVGGQRKLSDTNDCNIILGSKKRRKIIAVLNNNGYFKNKLCSNRPAYFK